MSKKGLQQKIMYTLSTGLLACTFAFTPVVATPVAHANSGTLNTIAQIFGAGAQIKAQYDAVKSQMIAWSNNVAEQEKIVQETVNANGLDNNLEHNERVTRVLNQLIENGNYVLKPNQLPFRWRVVNSEEWNASCYPNDYIVVNSKLVEDLQNDDALAMVMSHEMIHGLHQHVANDSAKQVLYKYGAALLTMKADYIQSVLGGFIANYVTVKNTTNVSEGDADESGFYLLTSAGFNPGGAPVEAIHMVNLGDSRDVISDFFAPKNHPASATRFKRLEKQMEEYGYNHAKVKNGTNVYIDDKILLVAHESRQLKDWEKAYLIAGGISKGIHDNKHFMDWNFNDATQDFLTDDKAYVELKEAIRSQNLYNTFQEMIRNSYNLDTTNSDNIKTKNKLIKEEEKRNSKLEKQREEIIQDKNYSKKNYNKHFEEYNKLGLRKLALKEAQKSYDLEPDYISAGNLARAYYSFNVDYERAHGEDNFDSSIAQKSIDYSLEALSKAPEDDKKWLIGNLAYYYYQAKDVVNAEKTANEYAQKYPNYARSQALLGSVAHLKGNDKDAVQKFAAAVSKGYVIDDNNEIPQSLVERIKNTTVTTDEFYSQNE